MLADVLFGNKPASEIRKTWETDHAKNPRGALRMRFSDNHDERRAIARFGEKGALAAELSSRLGLEPPALAPVAARLVAIERSLATRDLDDLLAAPFGRETAP